MQYDEQAFDAFMFPLERVALAKRRRALIPKATGRVLEVGVGTGANLPYYDWESISRLELLDVSLTEVVRNFVPPNGTELRLREGRAEELPHPDGYFDTVVSTLVFCSVERPDDGLREIRRVLGSGGRFLFIEHVRPSETPGFARVVDAVNPLWHSLSGECNINRDTISSIREAGFRLDGVSRGRAGLIVCGTALR